ncbi:enterochelin esterase domain-containing protein [Microbacterium luticocti]|uniref:enterochelin esterase domain-containing protein n=1 Tax=Microbacterium luticocti TaxID=451764 RepID=UPI0004260BC0|nr:enterochelin esterase domain-containing protein [Microbacterium luticocti]
MSVAEADPVRGVPRADGGGPVRADSDAHRRLRRGIRPEQISATWPVIGDAVVHDGRMLHPVTFAADAEPGHEVMVHLNGVTDGHRDDIRPALLEPVGGGVHALTYLLPPELCVSYRFAAAVHLPRDAGRTRDGWLRIHSLGRPDPRNPDTLPNPLGTTSSVLTMPKAPQHPAFAPDPVDPPPVTTVCAGEVPLTVVHGDLPEVLVLFDGQWWEQLGIAAALARRRRWPTTVLVPAGSRERRSRLLPHPDRLLPYLREKIVPAVGEVIGRWDAAATVVAGQSYGGLAAALAVCLAPEIAQTAIVQSGSFHFRADDVRTRPDAAQTGDLVAALASARVGGRFVVQAGTEEHGMIAGAEAFAAAATSAGAEVDTRWYTGGHDYAWWRTGLFDALDALGL